MRAALELFTENGNGATTVIGIAERAGLTKTTFFRYFLDKREVTAVVGICIDVNRTRLRVVDRYAARAETARVPG